MGNATFNDNTWTYLNTSVLCGNRWKTPITVVVGKQLLMGYLSTIKPIVDRVTCVSINDEDLKELLISVTWVRLKHFERRSAIMDDDCIGSEE